MSEKIIAKALKERSFGRLYYIYGEEEYLKRYYYDGLVRDSVQELPEFNVIEFNGKSFDYGDFCNSINGYPVMSERKTVGVIDFDGALLKKSFLKDFVNTLRQIPDFCTVVFLDTVMRDGLSNTSLLKAVTESGGVAADIGRPSPSQLMRWMLRHFKTEGKAVSEEDAAYLLETVDTDMLSLKNEITKLCNAAKGDTVTRADIDAVAVKSTAANRFELTDAFCAGDYGRVTDIIDRLYRNGEDDIMIANVFYRGFLDMYNARLALDCGKGKNELVAKFGMRPYGASMALKNARRLSAEFLREALLLSLKLDKELKSTAFDKRGLITVYTAELVSRRENGKAAH